MASVTHKKVSSVPDGADTSVVRPSDWNDTHDVTLDDADIPATIARDTEVTAAVAAHTGDASDAHEASAVHVVDAGGNWTADDVEGVLSEDHTQWQTAISGHTGDTSDAHDASAVSFVPAGSIAATDVQAAIAEVNSDLITAIGTVETALAAPNYLVGTATGTLANEIAVGTTPGGELGNTWASPTVDATHSGSTHSAATDTHIADASDAHDASAISIVDAGGYFTGTEVEAALQELGASSGGGGGGSVIDQPNFGDATGWTTFGTGTSADFGSAVADHLTLSRTPANNSTDAYFGVRRAWSPSAGDRIRVMVRAHDITVNVQAVGMFAGNIASGKALAWEAYATPPVRYHWRAFSSLTGSVNDADSGMQAGLHGVSGQAGLFGPFWLEMEFNSNTSYDLRYSHDGWRFVELVSAKAPDSAFTADCWGVQVFPYGSSNAITGLFCNWQEL